MRERLPLVLLPGMDGTGDLFAGFVRALGADVEAHVVRYPVNESDPAALRDLARQALPRTGAFVLLAESFSGPIAIELAAERPLGLRGLILVCTYVRHPRPWLGRIVARLPLRPSARVMLGARAPRELRDAFAHAVAQVPPRVLRARLRSLERVDVRPALRAIEAPILVVEAARDHVLPARATRELLQSRADAKHVVLDGPHLLLQAEPIAAAASILPFLRAALSEGC